MEPKRMARINRECVVVGWGGMGEKRRKESHKETNNSFSAMTLGRHSFVCGKLAFFSPTFIYDHPFLQLLHNITHFHQYNLRVKCFATAG